MKTPKLYSKQFYSERLKELGKTLTRYSSYSGAELYKELENSKFPRNEAVIGFSDDFFIYKIILEKK